MYGCEEMIQTFSIPLEKLILIQERKICAVNGCYRELTGWDLKHNKKFCTNCVRTNSVLVYHCGRCGTLLTHGGLMIKDWCTECSIKSQRKSNFNIRYEKVINKLHHELREAKRKQFLDEE